MTDSRGLDPIQVKPGGKRWLALLAAAAVIVALGLYALGQGDPVFTLFGILFIGLVVVGGPFVVWRMTRGAFVTNLRPDGLQIGPGAPVILWDDIESFGTFPSGVTPYTTVTLNRYASWISQVPADQQRRMLTAWKAASAGFGGLALLQLATIRGPSDILSVKDAGESWQLMQESNEVKDVISMLVWNRGHYGGDLVIGWLQRDRSAEQLADLLREYQRRALVAETSGGASDEAAAGAG